MKPTEWTKEGGSYCYMFIVNEYYDSNPIEDSNNMKMHILLEFLDMLKILEYTRGYDGIYYDIDIKIRKP